MDIAIMPSVKIQLFMVSTLSLNIADKGMLETSFGIRYTQSEQRDMQAK
jgi:hypothetical protein